MIRRVHEPVHPSPLLITAHVSILVCTRVTYATGVRRDSLDFSTTFCCSLMDRLTYHDHCICRSQGLHEDPLLILFIYKIPGTVECL